MKIKLLVTIQWAWLWILLFCSYGCVHTKNGHVECNIVTILIIKVMIYARALGFHAEQWICVTIMNDRLLWFPFIQFCFVLREKNLNLNQVHEISENYIFRLKQSMLDFCSEGVKRLTRMDEGLSFNLEILGASPHTLHLQKMSHFFIQWSSLILSFLEGTFVTASQRVTDGNDLD